jgi:putative ABC transport system permease protein
MRPEAPAAARRSILDRLHLLAAVGPAARMIARNLARRPLRALLTMTGMAFAVSLMVVGWYFFDAVEYMADLQFQRIERQDATVTFAEARASRSVDELIHLPGVLAVEPFRTVPARLRHGHYRYRIGLQGLPSEGVLRVLLDRHNRRSPLPPRGVLLTTELARILHAVPGDSLTVEVLDGRRPVRSVVLAGTIDELIGVGAYLRLDELFGLLEEGPTYSGARLEVDAAQADRLYATLKRVPAVATVSVRQAVIDSFNQTLAGSMRISTRVMLVFACVIAVAVVYNGARVTLSERGRELASLRVLGYTKGEVALVLFGELGLLTVLSLPLGWLLGIGICALMPVAFNTELYRLPLVITVKTQLFAAAVVLLSAVATGLVVRRRLNRLNLVAVLKTRE